MAGCWRLGRRSANGGSKVQCSKFKVNDRSSLEQLSKFKSFNRCAPFQPFKSFEELSAKRRFGRSQRGLRARKTESCIRLVTSVNKEAPETYDDDVLKKLGCRRERDDKFHYEVKREEVELWPKQRTTSIRSSSAPIYPHY